MNVARKVTIGAAGAVLAGAALALRAYRAEEKAGRATARGRHPSLTARRPGGPFDGRPVTAAERAVLDRLEVDDLAGIYDQGVPS